jgi:hypothetical protein
MKTVKLETMNRRYEDIPFQLQILNDFIWEKPQVVVKLLKENGIKVSRNPILPEITQKSVQAIADNNVSFVRDVTNAIKSNDEANFDPITLGVSALLTIGGAIFGGRQAKKQREAMITAKLMELNNNEKLTLANIQAMKEQGRIKIMTDTILAYATALQSEATQRQKDTTLFIGIMAIGLAIVYSSIQIFKK